MTCIAEDQLQTIYDAHDYYMEMEAKFDDLYERSKRIINAKRSLFIGTPYCSKLKANKERTYDTLQRLQNDNITQMAKLF